MQQEVAWSRAVTTEKPCTLNPMASNDGSGATEVNEQKTITLQDRPDKDKGKDKDKTYSTAASTNLASLSETGNREPTKQPKQGRALKLDASRGGLRSGARSTRASPDPSAGPEGAHKGLDWHKC